MTTRECSDRNAAANVGARTDGNRSDGRRLDVLLRVGLAAAELVPVLPDLDGRRLPPSPGPELGLHLESKKSLVRPFNL